MLAPTCFGSSLPSSWSFFGPSELFEIQIEWLVYRYVVTWPVCRIVVVPRNYDNPAHRSCISSNSEGSKKLPDDGRRLPKHVGASIQNKGVVKSVHIVGHF
jgi:hypothetical protein